MQVINHISITFVQGFIQARAMYYCPGNYTFLGGVYNMYSSQNMDSGIVHV